MKFGDIILGLLIIAVFVIACLVSYLSKGFKNIQNNWPEYRCNPLIMPFANHFGHDPGENFSQCIGQMQSAASSTITAPLHAGQHMLSQGVSNITTNVNSFRKLQGGMRPAIGGNITNIFGVFQNVLIEFQSFVTNFKDMLMKLLGVVATMVYMLSGQQMLGNSIMEGPVLATLKTIGGGASMIGL